MGVGHATHNGLPSSAVRPSSAWTIIDSKFPELKKESKEGDSFQSAHSSPRTQNVRPPGRTHPSGLFVFVKYLRAVAKSISPGGPLVRPHPGVRRSPPRGRFQSASLRHPGDPDSRSAPLLEGPDRRATTEARQGLGGRHRSGGHNSAQEKRDQASRTGRHPDPGSPSPARAIQEISRPSLPRRQPGCASWAPRGLRPVRGHLSRSRRETPDGRPQRLLSCRELPSWAAVRGRVIRGSVLDLTIGPRLALDIGWSGEVYRVGPFRQGFRELEASISGSVQ